MSNDKVKFYKNPKRSQVRETAKPYTPQYQLMGVEPREHKGGIASAIATPSTDNPRVRSAPAPQPYGENATSPLGRGKGPMLNVGNNVEHSWAVSVDGQIVDDVTEEEVIEADHPMIDNNDFVTPAALGIPEELPSLDEVVNPPRKRFIGDEVNAAFDRGFRAQPVVVKVQDSDLDLVSAIQEMEEETYLLMVSGVPICSGPQEEVQEQARLLVFGEHELCAGNPIPIDDLAILRRAKIKVGLFVE